MIQDPPVWRSGVPHKHNAPMVELKYQRSGRADDSTCLKSNLHFRCSDVLDPFVMYPTDWWILRKVSYGQVVSSCMRSEHWKVNKQKIYRKNLIENNSVRVKWSKGKNQTQRQQNPWHYFFSLCSSTSMAPFSQIMLKNVNGKNLF